PRGSAPAAGARPSQRWSSSDVLTVATRDAHLLAVGVEAVANASGLAVGVDQHHVGDVNLRLLRDDAAGLRAALSLADPRVLLDPVHALHEHLVLAGEGLDDLALGALVLAGDDENRVALLDLHLEHLRCQRDDLHELTVPQLPADRAEDARAARFVVVLDQYRGVLVEPDVRAIRTALLLLRTHDDRAHHIALLHAGAGDGVLDRGDDGVADACVPPAGTAEHADGQDLLRTRVV